MLVRLSIRDIVLIDRLDIDFAEGLSVLTGETGAGKSILLDAFALALGARGDAGLVRHGAEQGQVTAVFELPSVHPVRHLLSENGIAAPDGQLILRRTQLIDGRTRAFVNDQPVGAQLLRSAGATLVEIHGQHDERALIDVASHRQLLDLFAGLESKLAEVEQSWAERRSRERELAEHRAAVERARREVDWLRHAVEELTALDPQPEEEASLAERRTTLMQAEKVADELREAHKTVAGAQSPLPLLSTAVRSLERRAAQAPLVIKPVVKAFDSALLALEEVRTQLAQALRASDSDPRELERIEERLFALRAAGRKHNVGVADLDALRQRYADDLRRLDAGAQRLAEMEKEVQSATDRYGAAAEALSQHRNEAARRLELAVNRELKPLRLDRARFFAHVETDAGAAGPHGIDRIEFRVQTNPGTRAGPLMKVASGGELARFLLALKVVLADRGSAPTLVFDEIDTGAGGAVADAMGARLARLSGRAQVIAVTHAPQVAARADYHYLIVKSALDRGRRVATRVMEIAAEKRREEIARMLAGAEITLEARAAADRLIRAAG